MASWPCLALPLPTKTTPCVPATPPSPCRLMRAYTEEVRRTRGSSYAHARGSQPGKWWCGPSQRPAHGLLRRETTHLAARMEQLATPGSIRLSAADPALGRGPGAGHGPGASAGEGAWRSPSRCLSWWAPVPCAGACRPRLPGASRPSWGGRNWTLTPGSGTGADGPRPGGRPGGGRAGKSRLVYECVHSPHPGLARAGERLGVLRQGHATSPSSTC